MHGQIVAIVKRAQFQNISKEKEKSQRTYDFYNFVICSHLENSL